jgi:putative aminopeptidase FrvX
MELLRVLSNTPGVSGFEDPVQHVIKAELEPVCDSVHVDKIGNVIGFKRGVCNEQSLIPLKVMLAAHMDEIGFMVKYIDRDGFVRFMPIGGFDPRTLVAQRVIIHGQQDVKGVIAPQPNWIMNDKDRQKVLDIKELIIDTGMDRETISNLVSIGDVISLAQSFDELNDNVVIGRNFDDRVGVYAMLEAMKRIDECQVDVYAVATVQEEVGLRGVPTAAYAIGPDVGIALDGSLASDVPYAKEEEKHCIMGAGTGIYVMDNLTISDRKLFQFLLQLAQKEGIKTQINLGGGTDASIIQRHRTGARVCTIGAPTRYMHSTVQMCSVEDIESTIELLVAFLHNAHTGELG